MSKAKNRSIESILSDLAPGYILSIGRPGSIFQHILGREGWNPDQFITALPDCLAFRVLGGLNTLNSTMIAVPKYIVSGRNYQYVMNDGRDLYINTIDHTFSSFKDCSAIEIKDCEDALGVLIGAKTLINKYRPLIFVQVDRYNIHSILAVIRSFGYRLSFEFSEELTQNPSKSNEPVRFLAAIQTDTCSTFDIICADRAERSRLNQTYLWKAQYRPHDFARGKGSTLELIYGQSVIWTGPHQKTLFQLWPPLKGFYSLVIEVISETTSSEIEEILVGGGVNSNDYNIERDGIILRASRTVFVRQCDVDNGFIFALVSRGVAWRSIKNESYKVGLAILSIRLHQL